MLGAIYVHGVGSISTFLHTPSATSSDETFMHTTRSTNRCCRLVNHLSGLILSHAIFTAQVSLLIKSNDMNSMEINRLNQKTASGPSTYKARESIELQSSDKSGHLDTIEEEPPVSSHGDLSGLYLGILNIFTTLPQFIGTFISWIVFSILEPGKSPELAKDAHPDEHHSTDGPNAIAVCLFIGALAAVVAAYKTEKYARMLRADNHQS